MFNFNWETVGNNALIISIIVFEMILKAIGLWKSAKRGDLIWFIAILSINLFGIISLLYLWRTKQLEPTLRDVQSFFKSKFNK